MRTMFFAAALLAAGAVSASSQNRDVPEFDAVHIAGGIRATVEIGAKRSVRLEASEDVLAQIETRVENGELQVGFRRDSGWHGHRDVSVSIQAPALRGVGASGGSIVKAALTRADRSSVQASGGSEIHVRGVDAAVLRVQGSGGAVVELEGRADAVDVELSGGSHLEGGKLKARDVDIEGSGGSVGELHASGTVHGALSGGSRLHVHGNPKTRVASSGGAGVDVDD